MNGEQTRILRLLAKADEDVMKVVFDYYAPGVKQYARKCLRNDADAEDVTQLVFTRLYFRARENRGLHKQYESLEQLVYAIVSGLLKDVLRTRASDSEHETILLDLPVVRPRRPDELLLGKELQGVVHEAVDGLVETQRPTADLVVFKDHTLEEAARVTDVPVNTAKTRWSRSRKVLIEQLRKYLKGSGQ